MTDRNNERGTQPHGVLPSRGEHDAADDDRVDPEEILDLLDGLEVYVWKYTAGGTGGSRHLGPAAEDFYETFEVGEDADHIAAGDADGVALAAIQGLHGRQEAQHDRIERQEQCIERQREIIDEQREDLESLRAATESIQADVARLRADVLDDGGH